MACKTSGTGLLALLIATTTIGTAGAEAAEKTPTSERISHWAGDAEQVGRWVEFCIQSARRYELVLGQQRGEKFRLLPDPLFRHGISGHPGDWGVAVGPVVLWVDGRGRPAMLADLIVYPSADSSQRTMQHEFYSLAAGPLTIALSGGDRWTWSTGRAGLKWKPIANAPVPADSETARLRQMRQLTERFRADALDHKQGHWEYRLIPRPVYRYPTGNDPELLDGAMFLYCEGSDPELVLMFEARRTADGHRWHYAFASLSGWAVHARLDGAEVWSQPMPLGDPPGAVHFSHRFVNVTLP